MPICTSQWCHISRRNPRLKSESTMPMQQSSKPSQMCSTCVLFSSKSDESPVWLSTRAKWTTYYDWDIASHCFNFFAAKRTGAQLSHRSLSTNWALTDKYSELPSGLRFVIVYVLCIFKLKKKQKKTIDNEFILRVVENDLIFRPSPAIVYKNLDVHFFRCCCLFYFTVRNETFRAEWTVWQACRA